jgi:hypothetical protein
MIKPTVGRVVHFHENLNQVLSDHYQPMAALVCYVHDDRLINIAAFSHTGQHWPLAKVPLIQEGDPTPPLGTEYCSWMPFQIGQAQKTEQLQSSLDRRSAEGGKS